MPPVPPWWVVRLRGASLRELAWRARRAPPPRPCPPGPDPVWPWPRPTLAEPGPADRDVAPPLPRRGRWPTDPKPAWSAHRLHGTMRAHLAGAPTDVQGWWRRWGAHPGLWSSTHPVAERVPALVLLGHREALWAHADHLRRHPSRYSSEGNHRVAELGALALASLALPDLGPAPPLRPVLARQLHPDGWGREQSVAYLAYVLEWATIAHRCGEDLADLLALGATALATVLADDGSAPAIGDDGGDAALPGDTPYAASVVAIAAAAAGVSAPPSCRPGLRGALLGLPPPPHRPAPPRCLPAGGLTVLANDRIRVVFDHGPVGMPPLYGHAHADALAVWAHRDGHPWLVGRGTRGYHGPERRHDRGGRGECTLVVQGVDLGEPHPHPFLWISTPEANLEALTLDPRGGRVRGRSRRGARTHRRTVHLDGDVLTIVDAVEGTGRVHVALRWHVAPGAELGPAEHPLPCAAHACAHASGYGQTETAVTWIAEGVVDLPVVLTTRFTAPAAPPGRTEPAAGAPPGPASPAPPVGPPPRRPRRAR